MKIPLSEAISNKRHGLNLTIVIGKPEEKEDDTQAEEQAEHEGQEPEEEAEMHSMDYIDKAKEIKQEMENKRLSPEEVFGEMSEEEKALPAHSLRAKVMRQK